MDTENLRFNLFEIFDNMMGDKKKFHITKNLDVYTTRTGDIHKVIRVHWEIPKTEEEMRRDYRKLGNHYGSHCYKKLFPYTTEGMYAAIDYLKNIPEHAF